MFVHFTHHSMVASSFSEHLTVTVPLLSPSPMLVNFKSWNFWKSLKTLMANFSKVFLVFMLSAHDWWKQNKLYIKEIIEKRIYTSSFIEDILLRLLEIIFFFSPNIFLPVFLSSNKLHLSFHIHCTWYRVSKKYLKSWTDSINSGRFCRKSHINYVFSKYVSFLGTPGSHPIFTWTVMTWSSRAESWWHCWYAQVFILFWRLQFHQ